MRTLEELVDRADPGIAVVREWIGAARRHVEELPCERADGERALLALQVTTRSPLGAIAYGTGGLLVDQGWVRVLGARSARMARGVDDWNGLPPGATRRVTGALLVGDDALGGFFAWNGGGLPGPKNVLYLAPDTLEWVDTQRGYGEWLRWLFEGDLDAFHGPLRWSGWERDVATLRGDRAFHVLPPPWTVEGRSASVSRRDVPLDELWRMHWGDGASAT